MLYFVLDDQGNQYGPVDLPTLNSWVREGRIMPNTRLLVQNTGKTIPATMVPGLNLDMAPGIGLNPAGPQTQQIPKGFPMQGGPAAGPQPWNSPQGGGAFSSGGYSDSKPGSASFGISLALSAFGLLCGCGSPIGVLLGIAALVFARKAQGEGHPNGNVALSLSIGTIAISAVTSILFAKGMSSALGGIG